MAKKEIANITAGIAIIDKENNVLVKKRNSKESLFPGLYSIPAGKIILGETLEETAKREVIEEVNLTIDQFVYVNSYCWDNNILFVFAARVDSFGTVGKSHKLIRENEFAPNIKKAISEALSINFCDTTILELIEESITLVINNIVEIDGKRGWDHFLFQNRIGILGTAVGLCILDFGRRSKENTSQIYESLLSYQKRDGGWGIKGADNKYSIVESTCFCLKALRKQESPSSINIIKKGKEWLINNRLRDFSWGVNGFSKNGRVTPTCLAIETLWLLGESDIINESIKWLLLNKNSDDGWGFTATSQSCLSATSEVIILLATINESKYHEHITKATKWLIKKIDSTALIDESEQEYVNNTKRFEFKHSTKVKVLKALIIGQKSLISIHVQKLINEIINSRNKNGAWEHSLTPNNYPIWHLYDIVDLLVFINKNYKLNNLNLLNQRFEQLEMQKSLLVFINDNIPYYTKKKSSIKFT